MNGPIRLRLTGTDDPAWAYHPAMVVGVLQMATPASPAVLTDAAGEVRGVWPTAAAALTALGTGEASQRLGTAAAVGVDRWAGFLGYGLAGQFESVRLTNAAPIPGVPAMFLAACVGRTDDSAVAVPPPEPAAPPTIAEGGRDRFIAAVERGLAYIAAGDVFQVNLAHVLQARTTEAPDAVFARLAQRPARYGAFIAASDWAVVSHSPELFLRVAADGTVTTRPIKGTRPAGTPDDAQLAAELWASEKDRAELAMIVDLMRNDLGRVAVMGSVKVAEPRALEQHPTVLQAVATIRAKLRPGVGPAEVVAATFPCGSVTGAPKVRAMQIIDELEGVGRGVYCGAIGWIADGGSREAAGETHTAMHLSVAIRTMTFGRRDEAGWDVTLPVGAGIVADSVPADEWAETLVKARAMLAGLRAKGMRLED